MQRQQRRQRISAWNVAANFIEALWAADSGFGKRHRLHFVQQQQQFCQLQNLFFAVTRKFSLDGNNWHPAIVIKYQMFPLIYSFFKNGHPKLWHPKIVAPKNGQPVIVMKYQLFLLMYSFFENGQNPTSFCLFSSFRLSTRWQIGIVKMTLKA